MESKGLISRMIMLTALVMAGATPGAAQTIICDGLAAGGTGTVSCGGTRDYVYRVTDAASSNDSIFIGTHDPDPANYTLICMPTGWNFGILPITRNDYNSVTPHGGLSLGPAGTCPYSIVFIRGSGIPLSAAPTDFGFNHSGFPHDVSWRMADGATTTTDWSDPVGNGGGPIHGPLECDTLCEQSATMTTYRCEAGTIGDDFVGPEPTSPGPGLEVVLSACGVGNPVGAGFDEPVANTCFGHTFSGCWDTTCCVVAARLHFRLRASGVLPSSDVFSLREDGAPVWGTSMNTISSMFGAGATWDIGEIVEGTLNLGSLPAAGNGITNVLSILQDGDLDILIQDDTEVDFLELEVDVCCDTCFATLDINGDGIINSVSDLTSLISFVYHGGPPPFPLYQGDLNADGYVDHADVELLACAVNNGIAACFAQYPILTDCNPDTIRGACCEMDTCFVRSPDNCAAAGGTYFGDGTSCLPNNPCRSDIAGVKFRDLDCDGVRDPNEPGMDGVLISIVGGSISMVAITGGDGSYQFTGLPAGTYILAESIPQGMVQTAPPTVSYTVNLPPGVNLGGYDFGNIDSTCTDGVLVGVQCADGGLLDDFAGPEPSNPSPALQVVLQNCGNPSPFFDSPMSNQCFGHTLDCWDSTCCIIDAQLCVRARVTSGPGNPSNDAFVLLEDGVRIWSTRFATLNWLANNDSAWQSGDIIDTCLDLDNLPLDYSTGVSNILASLQDGDLDVFVQDDTEIDFLDLRLTECCPLTCSCPNQGDPAPLSGPGDGVVNVLDVVAGIDEVFRSGPATHRDSTCPNDRLDVAPIATCGDGVKNVLDVVALIDFVFRSGPVPCDPCSASSSDPTSRTNFLDGESSGGRQSAASAIGTLNPVQDGDRWSVILGIDAPSSWRAAQLEWTFDRELADVVVETDVPGLTPYWSIEHSAMTLGLLNMRGESVVAPNTQAVVRLSGAGEQPRVELNEGLLVDTDNQVMQVSPVVLANVEAATPSTYTLGNAYPNPFNAGTVIEFSISSDEHVLLEVFDVLGRRVKTLVNDFTAAGSHSVSWDTRDDDGKRVASGMYFYRITAGTFSEARKMVLMK